MVFPDNRVELPLMPHNAISYLPVRYPTDEDMNEGIEVHLSDDFPLDPTLFCNNVSKAIASCAMEDLQQINPYPSLVDLLHRPFNICGVKHNVRHDISAERLSELWHISISNDARTLKCVDLEFISTITLV